MDHIVDDFEDQVSITVDDPEVPTQDSGSDSETDSASSPPTGPRFTDKELMLQRVEVGSKEFEIIRKSFLNGTRSYWRNNIHVVGIFKRLYDSGIALERARIESFRAYSKAVASKNGGDVNITYAWYGGSREEICEILSRGFFGVITKPENRTYGHGVHLSHANFPGESVSTSVVDPDGLRHMLLCRLIVGKAEAVCAGSQQYQPTSLEFDSGVDNLSTPKKYIIWGSSMSTHILPVFVVSFKMDSSTGSSRIRIPNSPYMTLTSLVRQLAKHLDSSKMAILVKQHKKFQENRITRMDLIRSFRAIAGDEVIRAVVQVYR